MDFTDQQREQAFESASRVQKKLYDSPESGEALASIAKNHGLTEFNPYSDFLIAIGDVIIGLVPQEQLPRLLTERLQINQANSLRITADVLDFLAPLNEPVATPVPINTDRQSVETNNTPDTLAAELAATEAAFHQLQPIRTMAHDMETLRTEDEPVHQAASQETLLNGQGNAVKNTQAQWGTPEK